MKASSVDLFLLSGSGMRIVSMLLVLGVLAGCDCCGKDPRTCDTTGSRNCNDAQGPVCTAPTGQCDTASGVCRECLTDAHCNVNRVGFDCPSDPTVVNCEPCSDARRAAGNCFECRTNSDCATQGARSICDVIANVCRSCLPSPDTCGAGSFCDVAGGFVCQSGCKGNVSGECPSETQCLNHACVPGCTTSATCLSGQTCLDGACFTNTWTLKPTSGAVGPALGQAVFVADTINNQIIVFGGENATGASDELWTLSFSATGDAQWQRRLVSGDRPTSRLGAGGVFDAQRGRVVIHGGGPGVGSCSGYFAETWSLDVRTFLWTRIWDATRGTPGPGKLANTQLAYDAARGVIVVFGGQAPDNPSPCYDSAATWELSGTTWTQVTTPPSRTPSARANAMLTTDATTGKVVLFGGQSNSDPNNVGIAETWVYDGAGWDRLSGQQPPGRSRAAFGFEPLRRKMILFGGFPRAVTSPLDDTWEFSPSTLSWSPGAAGMPPVRSPTARQLAHIAAMPGTNELVLFGGMTNGNVPSNEVWVYGGR